MCPSEGHRGGLGYWLLLLFWDPSRRKLQPVAKLLAVSFLLCVFAYCFPLLSACGLCLFGCWVYKSSGRQIWRLAKWRQLLGITEVPAKRLKHIQPRRQRETAAFKWSPADLLLLMGSYMGKQEPPPRALGRGGKEIKAMLTRPNPDVVTPARRLSFRETPVVTNRAYMSPRRRYPIHQPQYNMAGSLPMVCLDGYQRKTLLSPRNHGFRSPVTVKIARPDASTAHSPVLNLLSPSPASPSTQCPPDPCAKETVLNAIRESKKRLNKDDDNTVFGGIVNKRRRHGSRGSGAGFEPLVTNGLQSYPLSKPDSMKRGQNMQAVDETASKRSRTSSNSSLSNATMSGVPMSAHNAISSSYSSTKDLLQKRKRSMLNNSIVSSTASSRCQTPEWPVKKAKGDMHEDTSQSTPVKSDSSNNSSGQVSDTPISKWSSAINTTSESGGVTGGRKCKLLPVSSGRGDQYQLLPPPLVRYNINSKEFDSERQTAIQKLNKAVEDEMDGPPSSTMPASTASSVSFTQPTTQITPGLQSITASSNSLLQMPKMQSQSPPAPAATVTLEQSTNKATAAVPNVTLTFGVNASSAASQFSLSNATPSISAPLMSTSCSTTFPQPLGLTQSKPQSPKSGLLLQMLTKPEEKSSQPAFKPIFGAPPTVSSSTVPPATSSSETAPTFKPVFGESLNQPAATSAAMFKPIFGDSSSKPPASSSFTLQTVSSNATPSFPNLSSTGAATGLATGNSSKSIAALPVSTSNTVVSNPVPSFPFGGPSQSLPTATSSTSSVFGGSMVNAPQTSAAQFVQTPNSQASTGFTMFGSSSSTSTQPKSSNMFGSATSAFTATFGSKTNSFPSNNGTAAFNSSTGGELQANKSTANPTFGGSGVQSAFGSSSSQTTFGSTSQPAFGTTNTTLTFGNATPASTKAATFSNMNSTQTSSSTPNTNAFVSSNPTPFGFGSTTNSAGSFGGGGQSSTTGNNGFNFGAASTAPSASVFGNTATNQNNIASPNTTFAFGTPGATEQKMPFGTSTPAFGQAASTPLVPFGSPAPGFQNANPSFSPATPSFSIGSGSKPSAVRQRLMARRQHTRKK
ncbi:nuclear envelope pore membrane protein POM 121 [Spea bombifrons]|uniref:nuclear envelope pore membrane protein POM 121 n=1 Tax=Spea bombifrons TaxID=233779 RepID=UPI00234B7846|nr:nuclear envelope pore membrane protein POM 121 [Spea bombifrons]